jgi:hypothetical protein
MITRRLWRNVFYSLVPVGAVDIVIDSFTARGTRSLPIALKMTFLCTNYALNILGSIDLLRSKNLKISKENLLVSYNYIINKYSIQFLFDYKYLI